MIRIRIPFHKQEFPGFRNAHAIIWCERPLVSLGSTITESPSLKGFGSSQYATFTIMLRISFFKKLPLQGLFGTFDFFPISPVAIICRLTYFIPQNEWTRFDYITHYFNIKQKLLSNEYYSTPTSSI